MRYKKIVWTLLLSATVLLEAVVSPSVSALAAETSTEAVTMEAETGTETAEETTEETTETNATEETAEENTVPDYDAEQEERKTLVVQTNQIEGWPQGPAVGAEGAILMDADSGAVLYGKNIHEKLYPASTTKVMTALLTYENLSLDDTVTFSETAVHSITWDSSNIGLDAGEALSVREALYGLMVGSANEVASGLAERMGGSIENFAGMMNRRAKELGCTDTNFVNANGLFDANHYTSVYDMALISAEVFKHEELAQICNTESYHFTPTSTQPDDFTITNKHQLINGTIEYEGILGGKTGYTADARQTLVTCAQRDGKRLICVVFKEESPAQFEDTVALFDYGFNNFQKFRISDNERNYSVLNPGFMSKGNDVFGNHSLPYTLAGNGYVCIPKDAEFSDLTSEVRYSNIFALKEENAEDAAEGSTQEEVASVQENSAPQNNQEAKYNDNGQLILGEIDYFYKGEKVGGTDLLYTGSASLSDYASGVVIPAALAQETETVDENSTEAAASEESSEEESLTQSHLRRWPGPLGWVQHYLVSILHSGANHTMYVNVPSLLILIIVVSLIVIAILTIISYIQHASRRQRRARRARARREASRRERNEKRN